MIEFVKKYKGSILSTLIIVALGSVAMITGLKVGQKEPIAPNAPQKTLAAGTSCTFSFPIRIASTTRGLPIAPITKSLRCVGLSATPRTGNAPLTVIFYGHGYDGESAVTGATFVFGDGGKEAVKTSVEEDDGISKLSTTHTYLQSGTFTASVAFINNFNEQTSSSELCKVMISVF